MYKLKIIYNLEQISKYVNLANWEFYNEEVEYDSYEDVIEAINAEIVQFANNIIDLKKDENIHNLLNDNYVVKINKFDIRPCYHENEDKLCYIYDKCLRHLFYWQFREI